MFYIVINLITPRALFSPILLPYNQIRIGLAEQFQRRSKLYKMADGRHLGFGPTRNSTIQSADLKKPTLEPKMKWIG